MTPQYKHFRDRAQSLQYHFQDIVDKKEDARMMALKHEVRELVEDLEAEKHPRDVEERLKTIDHQLMQARYSGGDNPAISYGDIDGLHHSYQKMREDIRQLPHY